jgi:hypothetical protein
MLLSLDLKEFYFVNTMKYLLLPPLLVHLWYIKIGVKMPKLIKSYIDSLKIEEKSYEIWDTEIKGFGYMVHPSGRKTYYFVYRYKSSKK